MDASGAYTAGYSAGLKGQLLNSNYSADNTIQTSYTAGHAAGKVLYQSSFGVGYKDAVSGITQKTSYSANKSIQNAYNIGKIAGLFLIIGFGIYCLLIGF